MKPMPPSRAMRIAVAASVTVSIAELTSGMCSGIARGQPRADVDVARDDLAVRRDEQDVVEGQGFAKLVVEHGAPYKRGLMVARQGPGTGRSEAPLV